MSGLDLERIVLAGGPLGLMQAAFDVRFFPSPSRHYGGKLTTDDNTDGSSLCVYLLHLLSYTTSCYHRLPFRRPDNVN
jgi:hypothetical protein